MRSGPFFVPPLFPLTPICPALMLLLPTIASDNIMPAPIQLTRQRRHGSLERHAVNLNAALSDLIRAAQVRDRDCICCHDISVTQCNALEALQEAPMTLGGLTAALLLDKSTTSRVVDALVRKGYVERTAHPEDRRALQIRSTSKGTKLYQLIERSLQEQSMLLLAEFSPEAREAAIKIISQVGIVAMNQARETAGCCVA